jgi:hypothetical protein
VQISKNLKNEFSIWKLKRLSKYALISIILIAIFQYLDEYLGVYDISDHKPSLHIDNITEKIFVAVFFAPIIEEIVFRLPLKRADWFYLSLVCSLILLTDFKGHGLIVSYSVLIYLLFVFLFQYTNYEFFGKGLKVLSVIVFGFSHATNYLGNVFLDNSFFNVILMFSSQLIMGYFLVKIRIEISFSYAIYLHALVNFLIILLNLIFD